MIRGTIQVIARIAARGVGLFDSRRERRVPQQSCIACGVWGVRLNSDGECIWCEPFEDDEVSHDEE